MLRLPGGLTCYSDIFHQGLLIPPFFQRNAEIDDAFGARNLATVAKTHFLIEFVLLKNNI